MIRYLLVLVCCVGCCGGRTVPTETGTASYERLKHLIPDDPDLPSRESVIEQQAARIKDLESLLNNEQRAEIDALERKAESWKSFSWKQGKEIVALRMALEKAIDKKPVAEITKGVPWYDVKYQQMGTNGIDSGYILAPSILGDYVHDSLPKMPLLIYNGTAWHIPLLPDWNDGRLVAIATAKPGESIRMIHQWSRIGDRWEEITTGSWSHETLGELKTDEWVINGKTYRLVEVPPTTEEQR